MAKEKKTKVLDQHTSGLLVRFPESARATLDHLKDALGQPFTVAALRALADYAEKHGAPDPRKASES